MIKYVQCLRRHPDLSPADFRQHWEDYKGLWQSLADQVGAIRVSFSTTLAVEANDRIVMQRGTEEPYDGLVETWAHDAHDLQDRLASPEFRAARQELFSKQHQFLDLGRCCFFFCADD